MMYLHQSCTCVIRVLEFAHPLRFCVLFVFLFYWCDVPNVSAGGNVAPMASLVSRRTSRGGSKLLKINGTSVSHLGVSRGTLMVVHCVHTIWKGEKYACLSEVCQLGSSCLCPCIRRVEQENASIKMTGISPTACLCQQ